MRPRCYGCDKPAGVGRMFCTDKCAAGYCEELIRGNEQQYCPLCGSWESFSHEDDNKVRLLTCGHVETLIVEGMRDAEARALYTAAVDRKREAEKPLPDRCVPDRKFVERVLREREAIEARRADDAAGDR